MTPDQGVVANTPQADFDAWMRQLDRIVGELAGLSIYDLPDCTFRDWFDDGVGPREAAKMALRNAGA